MHLTSFLEGFDNFLNCCDLDSGAAGVKLPTVDVDPLENLLSWIRSLLHVLCCYIKHPVRAVALHHRCFTFTSHYTVNSAVPFSALKVNPHSV